MPVRKGRCLSGYEPNSIAIRHRPPSMNIGAKRVKRAIGKPKADLLKTLLAKQVFSPQADQGVGALLEVSFSNIIGEK